MTEEQSHPVSKRSRLKTFLCTYFVLLGIAYGALKAWSMQVQSLRNELQAQWDDNLRGTDSRSILLKSLEGQLKAKFTDEYLANTRIPYALWQLRDPERFPIREGSKIVSCIDDPTEADGRYGRLKAGEFIRLGVYVPAGQNKLLHGFKVDARQKDKSLPALVVHSAEAGQFHEVRISVRSENEKSYLVITVDPSSAQPETSEYMIGDADCEVTFDRRGLWCHWMLPNEQTGWCNAFAQRVMEYGGWQNQSDLPNSVAKFDVRVGKDRNSEAKNFSLRFGVQSDSPASASAVVVASRSKDLLKRVSAEGARWKSPSDGERAVRALLGGDFFGGVMEVVPTIEEIFEPENGSDRLIFRNGWAEKTLDPW